MSRENWMRRRSYGWMWYGILALVFCFFASELSAVALGQVSEAQMNSLASDAAARRQSVQSPAATQEVGIDFLSLLIKGGWFMIPIAVLSLMVVTFVFDRAIGLRAGRLLPTRFKRSMLNLIRTGDSVDPRAVYRLCLEYPSTAATIVRVAVLKTGRPQPEVLTAVGDATQREVDRAYSNVRWINLCAGLAPLLGLLGTVWGLIRAFHDTTQLAPGQNRADYLAVGIYEALVATMAGLLVAIPAVAASHFFEGRVTKIFGDIEELLAELAPGLERYEGKTRFDLIGREIVARDIGGVRESAAVVVPPPAGAVGGPHTASDSQKLRATIRSTKTS